MVNFFSKVDLKNKQVFIPLCGKTLDMVWLANTGAKVVGVELSQLAVESFFTENKIEYKKSTFEDGSIYISKDITIYCCDFFKLPNEVLSNSHYIFDRASLVALPKDIRLKYVEKIKLGIQNSEYLLVTFKHPGVSGPPFSIEENDVEEYFGEFHIKLLEKVQGNELFQGNEAEITNYFFLIKS